MARVEIRIGRDGQVKMEGHGFKGSACEAPMAALAAPFVTDGTPCTEETKLEYSEGPEQELE